MRDIIDDIKFDIEVLTLMGENKDCCNPVYYEDFLLKQIMIIGKIHSAGRLGLINHYESNNYIKQMTGINFNIMELSF